MLKSHSSLRTTVNRAPAAGCEATKSFHVLLREKVPLCAQEDAREALCANKPPLDTQVHHEVHEMGKLKTEN